MRGVGLTHREAACKAALHIALHVSARDAALGVLDEMDEVLDVRVVCGGGCFEGAEAVGEVLVFFQEQALVGGFDVADVSFRKTPALQTDEIHSTGAGRVAIYDHEGRDVLDDLCEASDDGVFPHTTKLVDGSKAGDDGVILDGDVACDAGGVREDDVVSELAVVGDVGVTE